MGFRNLQEMLEMVFCFKIDSDQLKEKNVLLFEIFFFANSQDRYTNSEKVRDVFEIVTEDSNEI